MARGRPRRIDQLINLYTMTIPSTLTCVVDGPDLDLPAVFVADGGPALSRGDFKQHVELLALKLRAAGLQPGDVSWIHAGLRMGLHSLARHRPQHPTPFAGRWSAPPSPTRWNAS